MEILLLGVLFESLRKRSIKMMIIQSNFPKIDFKKNIRIHKQKYDR